MRSAAAALAFVLCVASAPAARASDAAHPGVLVVDRDGALVVAAGTPNGAVPFIARIGADGRLRIVHRFVPYDTPGSLALIGARVYGLDGFPASGGHAFEVAGSRFRTIFRVPDDGFGTIAYDPGAPARDGLVFAIDGGRGALCHVRHGQAACGAIEVVGPGGARRIATFARPASAFPLAGNGRSAWFAGSDAERPRALELREGRVIPLGTGGRFARAAAPFGAGALFALELGDHVDVAWAGGGKGPLVTLARVPGVPKANAVVTLRSRGRAAYWLITWSGYQINESRLYELSVEGELRTVKSWQGAPGDSVQLHYVDARGDAIVSTEHREIVGSASTTRGTLLAIAPDGAIRQLKLGPLAARTAVADAVESPDGGVWSLLGTYGSAVAVVHSDAASARTYMLPAGKPRKST